MRGIDVSAYQGKPDWSAVRAAGIDLAIIRVANRKGKDASFEHNYTGCAVAGIRRGVYRYSYAKTVDEAVKEAMEVVLIWNGRSSVLLAGRQSQQSQKRGFRRFRQQGMFAVSIVIWTGTRMCWIQPHCRCRTGLPDIRILIPER